MNKRLTIRNADLATKVKVIINVLFGGLSATESLILTKLIHYSTNNSITLSADFSRLIQQELNITQSSFSTTLFRLQKKKLIEKPGKVIVLNPVFANIDQLEKLVIVFNPTDNPAEKI